jgi:hypothetical protein
MLDLTRRVLAFNIEEDGFPGSAGPAHNGIHETDLPVFF